MKLTDLSPETLNLVLFEYSSVREVIEIYRNCLNR